MRHLRSPRPRAAAGLLAAALAAVLAGCSADRATAPAPLPSTAAGEPLPVTLTSTVRFAQPGDPRERVAFAGDAGVARVQWEIQDGACMLARAAARGGAGGVVVTVARAGDPVALCVAAIQLYRYELRVGGLPAGRHRVWLVEERGDREVRTVGTAEVTVRPSGA